MSAVPEVREGLSTGSQFLLRWIGPPVPERLVVRDLNDVMHLWRTFVANTEWFDSAKQSLVVLALNHEQHFLGWHLVSMGSNCEVPVYPREVLRAALRMDASRIILVHNQTSGGSLRVSLRTEASTRAIFNACKMADLKLVDHVVVNADVTDAFSIKENAPSCFQLQGPQSAAARAEGVRFAGPAVKVTLQLPRPVLWMHLQEKQQDCLFAEVDGVNASRWVERWNAKSGLRKRADRLARYRILRPRDFILAASDYEEVKRAAAIVEQSPETLLAAILSEVSQRMDTFKKMDEANTPEAVAAKVVPFFRR